jgi:hypothetical protein
MSTPATINRAIAIIEQADYWGDPPVITDDPEVNYLVDVLLTGWEDIDDAERSYYISEAREV